eukprot:5263804-Amphidinium_carterae.1
MSHANFVCTAFEVLRLRLSASIRETIFAMRRNWDSTQPLCWARNSNDMRPVEGNWLNTWPHSLLLAIANPALGLTGKRASSLLALLCEALGSHAPCLQVTTLDLVLSSLLEGKHSMSCPLIRRHSAICDHPGEEAKRTLPESSH